MEFGTIVMLSVVAFAAMGLGAIALTAIVAGAVLLVRWLIQRGQQAPQTAPPAPADGPPEMDPGLRDARDTAAMLAATDAPSASRQSEVSQTNFRPTAGGGFNIYRVRPRGEGEDDEGRRVAEGRAFDLLTQRQGARAPQQPPQQASRRPAAAQAATAASAQAQPAPQDGGQPQGGGNGGDGGDADQEDQPGS